MNRTDELVRLAQRQRGVRDELMQRQTSLAREVAEADAPGFMPVVAVARVVLTLLLLVGPSLLTSACASVPDGRDMCTQGQRTEVLANANQMIKAL